MKNLRSIFISLAVLLATGFASAQSFQTACALENESFDQISFCDLNTKAVEITHSEQYKNLNNAQVTISNILAGNSLAISQNQDLANKMASLASEIDQFAATAKFVNGVPLTMDNANPFKYSPLLLQLLARQAAVGWQSLEDMLNRPQFLGYTCGGLRSVILAVESSQKMGFSAKQNWTTNLSDEAVEQEFKSSHCSFAEVQGAYKTIRVIRLLDFALRNLKAAQTPAAQAFLDLNTANQQIGKILTLITDQRFVDEMNYHWFIEEKITSLRDFWQHYLHSCTYLTDAATDVSDPCSLRLYQQYSN